MTIEALNPIQQRTLGLLAQGCSYLQIQKELRRSRYSVRKDIEIIREKTQIRSRVNLALFAVARGYALNPYEALHIKEVPHHYAHHD